MDSPGPANEGAENEPEENGMEMQNMLFSSAGVSGSNDGLSLEALARKAGVVCQESSGVWSLLQLGALAQSKLEKRSAKAMESLGACRVEMSCLQSLESWKKSGRAEAYGEEQIKVRCRGGKTMALAATAEEQACALVKSAGRSGFEGWIYQIGKKWRDELRARGALVRAKEFTMLDAYSFASGAGDIRRMHEESADAICSLLEGFGLEVIRREADCGEIGGQESVELRVRSSLGDADGELELAHLFILGDKYAKAFGLKSNAGDYLQMGCQGIGISRLLMALLESRRDGRGFWGDRRFALADCYVMAIGDSERARLAARSAYRQAQDAGLDAILDLRSVSAGKKFADAELAGIRERWLFTDELAGKGLAEAMDRKTLQTRTVAQGGLCGGLLES